MSKAPPRAGGFRCLSRTVTTRALGRPAASRVMHDFSHGARLYVGRSRSNNELRIRDVYDLRMDSCELCLKPVSI